MPVSFYGLTRKQLEQSCAQWGKERFRSQQLYKWVYDQKIIDPELMTNLSKDFRAEIKNLVHFEFLPILKHLISSDGTQKFLFQVGEGLSVEAVLIPTEDRYTLCISSEVGCNMACKFCYTGKQKLKRRLSTEEIVCQFIQVQNSLNDQLKENAERISNIVFMGMGEPLDNSEAVFAAIDILTDDFGMNLSRKRITVSTSGVVPEMHRIADAKVRLAVSLNAPNNEIRDQVMPINKKWPIKELFAACMDYVERTGDKVTFEYVLLKGVTDQLVHARELVHLTRNVPCKINIIPFNEHPDSGYTRPEHSQVIAFQNELMKLGVHVLLRRTRGRDIFAACGQLTDPKLRKSETMSVAHV